MLGLVRDTPAQSAQWALSGFGNATVWLIFAGYMFTLGYTQTGWASASRCTWSGCSVTDARPRLRRRAGRSRARAVHGVGDRAQRRHDLSRRPADPELYQSRPHDGTARRLGAYLLYTALAASFVTSSMFITALAPNTLAMIVMRQTAGVTVSWLDWFVGFAPVGIVLLVVVPWLLYMIYPPEIRTAPRRRAGRREQLRRWAR